MTSRSTAGGNPRKKEAVNLKGAEELEWLEETEEEAREYDQRIKDEIRWKLDPVKPHDDQPIPATSSPEPEGGKSISNPMARPSTEPTLPDSSEPLGDIDRDEGGFELEDQGEGFQARQADQTMMDFSMPSFRPSNIAHSTPKPTSASALPHAPTPTPKLPSLNRVVAGPSKTPRISAGTLVNETPAHIEPQVGHADQSIMDFSMPSFRPSNIAHSTPKPTSGSVLPHIPTLTPNLPSPDKVIAGPKNTPRVSAGTLVNETPAHMGLQAGEGDQTMMDFPMPSFRPSNIAHSTPKPISTSTFSHIPTPTFVSAPNLPSPNKVTPGPSKIPRHPPTTLVNETPMHIDSPIDTPTGEGRGRRDDPATPVPLGVEKFNLLKGKKDFQTLTKHFEMFTKQSERQKKLAAEPITRKGKMTVQGKGSEVLGGKVFEGLRICFPPELGNTSKQKTHWDIACLFSKGPHQADGRSPNAAAKSRCNRTQRSHT